VVLNAHLVIEESSLLFIFDGPEILFLTLVHKQHLPLGAVFADAPEPASPEVGLVVALETLLVAGYDDLVLLFVPHQIDHLLTFSLEALFGRILRLYNVVLGH
jgi:hypothetical protein